jgi:hypothetical protein
VKTILELGSFFPREFIIALIFLPIICRAVGLWLAEEASGVALRPRDLSLMDHLAYILIGAVAVGCIPVFLAIIAHRMI